MTHYKSFAPLWSTMCRNLTISALAGTLFGCALFPFYGAILQAVHRGNYALWNLKFMVPALLTSPFLIFYILPVLVPLVAIAFLAAFIFQNSIRKHLEIWCVLAPISVWLTTVIYFARKAYNSFDEQFNWWERILINLSDDDYILFLLAPAFSALVFYRLSKKA